MANNGNVLALWKDYLEYFDVLDWRTAERRLVALGFKRKKGRRGAPMIRRVVLDKAVDTN